MKAKVARDRQRRFEAEMRRALPVQCAEPGCPNTTLRGARCPIHRRSRWTPVGDYGQDWRKVRDAYIREHPRCQWPGCSARADEVDHVVAVRTDSGRRLDVTNLRSLCLKHHRARTGRDGARAQAEVRRRARGER